MPPAVLLLVLAALPLVPVHAGLLLHYTFDDQNDPTANTGTLGSTYDGALQGNPHFVAFGSGSALALNGDDAVWPGDDQTAFNIGDSDFSLFARFTTSVALSPSEAPNRVLISRENAGSQPRYNLSMDGDSGVGRLLITSTAAANILAEGTTPLNDGLVHEMWGIRSSDTLYLYVDGVLEGTAAIPSGWGSTDTSTQLTIGGRLLFADNADDWKGKIDEIGIYDIAVSPVPEPSGFLVGAACFLCALGTRRRNRPMLPNRVTSVS